MCHRTIEQPSSSGKKYNIVGRYTHLAQDIAVADAKYRSGVPPLGRNYFARADANVLAALRRPLVAAFTEATAAKRVGPQHLGRGGTCDGRRRVGIDARHGRR